MNDEEMFRKLGITEYDIVKLREIRAREIYKLHNLLEDRNIEHEFIIEENGEYTRRMIKIHDVQDGEKFEILSAILHYGSYGYEQGLIEILGLLTRSEEKESNVVGYLTAEDVFRRVKKYYRRKAREIEANKST